MVGVGIKGKGRTKPRCAWCNEKTELKYCLNVDHQKKDFCSEKCLHQFKIHFLKVTCAFCEKEITKAPLVLTEPTIRDFCNQTCYQSAKETNALYDKNNRNKKPNPVPFHFEATGVFDWDTYLKECNATAAPASNFKQYIVPPPNEFRMGMKIEASDPRNDKATCIATVVGTLGPLLHLRLDGGDNKNDFWHMFDSSEIHPIGHCEKMGGMLQPPMGYRMNASSWPNFKAKTLQHAEIAPDHCFIKEPPCPKSNKFEVGQKLEALDKKYPYLIYPATVAEVKDDMIFVTFDGWNGTIDYECKFDSRDIFPAGYCQSINLQLQLPGNKGSTRGNKFRSKQVPAVSTSSKPVSSVTSQNPSNNTRSKLSSTKNGSSLISRNPGKNTRSKSKLPKKTQNLTPSKVKKVLKNSSNLALSKVNAIPNSTQNHSSSSKRNVDNNIPQNHSSSSKRNADPNSLQNHSSSSKRNADPNSTQNHSSSSKRNADPNNLQNHSSSSKRNADPISPQNHSSLSKKNADLNSPQNHSSSSKRNADLISPQNHSSSSKRNSVPNTPTSSPSSSKITQIPNSPTNLTSPSEVTIPNSPLNFNSSSQITAVPSGSPNLISPSKVNAIQNSSENLNFSSEVQTVQNSSQNLTTSSKVNEVQNNSQNLDSSLRVNTDPKHNQTLISSSEVATVPNPSSSEVITVPKVISQNLNSLSKVLSMAKTNQILTTSSSEVLTLPKNNQKLLSSQVVTVPRNTLNITSPSGLSQSSEVQQVVEVSSTVSENDCSPSSTLKAADSNNSCSPGFVSYPTVCIHINHSCQMGPYLNSEKIAELPKKIGPDSITKVLKEAVQTIIRCASNEKRVFKFLTQGTGRVIITATFGGATHKRRLPPVNMVSSFWSYLVNLCKSLKCCENFYTSEPIEGGCIKCARKFVFIPEDSPAAQKIVPKLEKRHWAELSDSSDSIDCIPLHKKPKIERQYSSDSSEDNLSNNISRTNSYMQTLLYDNSFSPNELRVIKQLLDRVSKPSEWTVDDVIQLICAIDQNTRGYTAAFRKHEMDGKALLLLNRESMMKYLGVKLGPAVKIVNLVEGLRKIDLRQQTS